MEKLFQKSETYHIIGMCMEVHRQLGFGFSEIVYKDKLEIEAVINEFPVQRERQFEILYKGNQLKHKYFADFVMFDNIIVEIKHLKTGLPMNMFHKH